jgi:hypothetical protein
MKMTFFDTEDLLTALAAHGEATPEELRSMIRPKVLPELTVEQVPEMRREIDKRRARSEDVLDLIRHGARYQEGVLGAFSKPGLTGVALRDLVSMGKVEILAPTPGARVVGLGVTS